MDGHTSSSIQSFRLLRAYKIFLTFPVCFFFVPAPNAFAPDTPAAAIPAALVGFADPELLEEGTNELAGISVGFVRYRQSPFTVRLCNTRARTHFQIIQTPLQTTISEF